jgi:hypothetical protein
MANEPLDIAAANRDQAKRDPADIDLMLGRALERDQRAERRDRDAETRDLPAQRRPPDGPERSGNAAADWAQAAIDRLYAGADRDARRPIEPSCSGGGKTGVRRVARATLSPRRTPPDAWAVPRRVASRQLRSASHHDTASRNVTDAVTGRRCSRATPTLASRFTLVADWPRISGRMTVQAIIWCHHQARKNPV